MQSFIVLGIIPGTNIQLDLNFWIVASCLYALVLTRRFWFARLADLRTCVVAFWLAYTFDHSDLALPN